MPQLFLAAMLSFNSSIATAEDHEAVSQPASLTVGKPYTEDLRADQILSFVFAAEVNKSYLIDIDQGGLDLEVTVATPDGDSASFNSPLLRDESELVLLDTGKAGEFAITLLSSEYTGAIANITIQLKELTPSTEAERERMAGLHLISQASRANHLGTLEGWNSALEAYKQANVHLRNAGEDRYLARSLFSMATIEYWQMSKWDVSAELAARAAEIYWETGHQHLAANAVQLQAAAIIEKATGVEKSDSRGLAPEAKVLFDEALRLFRQALETQERLDFQYDATKIVNNIGFTYYYMGEWDTAAPYYHKAAASYRSLDEWRGELNSLSNLAVIDFEQGNLVKAIEWFQRTLEILPPDKLYRARADVLDNLGVSQLALGHLDDALRSFSKALSFHEGIDDLKGQGRSLTGIGTTYYAIGELELALEYLETALVMRQKTNDGRGQVSVLNFIGNIKRRTNDYSAALNAHLEASLLATSPIDQARILLRIGEDLVAANRPDEALETLAKAESVANETNNQKLIADTLRISGDAGLQARHFESSLVAYQQAASSYELLGLGAERSQAIFGTAKAARGLGQMDQALEYADLAIKSVETLRSQLIAPELRAYFLASKQDYYAFLIDLLMGLHEQSAGEGDEFLRQALSVSERSRARALIDLISEASITQEDSTASGISDRQTRLYQQMAERRYQLNKLLDKSYEAGVELQIAGIRQQLAETENKLNLLHIENRKRNPGYASLTDPQILDAAQIQGMLDNDSTLLQYALGENRSFVWLVTRDSIEAWALPARGAIEQSARRLYELLKVPAHSASAKTELAASLKQLSGQIFGPINPINHKRVIVAADGVLHYLPFSILNGTDPEDEYEMLLAGNEIVYLHSMSVLAAQRQNHQDLQQPAKDIAIFADPVFSSNDSRFRDVPFKGSAIPGNPSLQKTPVLDDPTQLKRLPATAQEALSIVELVDPGRSLLALGFDANLGSVVNANLGDYRIIHFATHGRIDSRYPALSSLAFSLFDESGEPRDGFLRLHDIYNLDLNAELVALSACSTALGREISGEGLTGLTQGLMYSGSKSVLASLWQVPDRATAELMKRFYQNLLDKKQKPAAALRNAQLDLAAEARWRSPYFWSAFVLQGDWQ